MFNVLSKIENIIFLFSLLIIIVLNIYGSIFMLASYWPCLDKNMFIPFVISLLLIITLIYFYNKFNISKNKAIVISLIVTLTSISFRLYLNKSFNVYPTSDQWQMLSGLNTLINENDFKQTIINFKNNAEIKFPFEHGFLYKETIYKVKKK